MELMALNFVKVDFCQYKSWWEMDGLLKELRAVMVLSRQMGLKVLL